VLLEAQAVLPDVDTADFSVVRALLPRGRSYEQAVKALEPYREIREPDESARRGMATVAGWATPMKPAFLFVNNRLEGNAPSTIEAVASMLVASKSRLDHGHHLGPRGGVGHRLGDEPIDEVSTLALAVVGATALGPERVRPLLSRRWRPG
jgi:hypothetical protein